MAVWEVMTSALTTPLRLLELEAKLDDRARVLTRFDAIGNPSFLPHAAIDAKKRVDYRVPERYGRSKAEGEWKRITRQIYAQVIW